jgi:hypothetical protein
MGGDGRNLGGLGLGASLLGSGTQLVGAIQGGKRGQRIADIGRPVSQIGGTLADYSMAQQRMAQQQEQQEFYRDIAQQKLDAQLEKLQKQAQAAQKVRQASQSYSPEERFGIDIALETGDISGASKQLRELQRSANFVKDLGTVYKDYPDVVEQLKPLQGKISNEQLATIARNQVGTKISQERFNYRLRQDLLTQSRDIQKQFSPVEKVLSEIDQLPSLAGPEASVRDIRNALNEKLQKISPAEAAKITRIFNAAAEKAGEQSSFLGFGEAKKPDPVLLAKELKNRAYGADAVAAYEEKLLQIQRLRGQPRQAPAMQPAQAPAPVPAPTQMPTAAASREEKMRRLQELLRKQSE